MLPKWKVVEPGTARVRRLHGRRLHGRFGAWGTCLRGRSTLPETIVDSSVVNPSYTLPKPKVPPTPPLKSVPKRGK